MANAVFIQNPESIYKDEPGVRYHFPKMYHKPVQACVGDWVAFYEGKEGALRYTSIQRVASAHPDPDTPDQSFARMVKRAYNGRCAISGFDLRNGLGRAEVRAAHIRPVQHKGPDVVSNGLALSATLHWMFDRGLISVGKDHDILVSDNKVAPDVRRRLISPSGKLRLPDNPRDHPHPNI